MWYFFIAYIIKGLNTISLLSYCIKAVARALTAERFNESSSLMTGIESSSMNCPNSFYIQFVRVFFKGNIKATTGSVEEQNPEC